MTRGIAQRAVVLEWKLEQVVSEKDHLLRSCEHAKVRREPQLERVILDEPIAERMEGGQLHVGVSVGYERVDTLLHLDSSLVRERERENLGRSRASGGDEVGDPPGHDRGLAGSGPGDDEERARVVSYRRRLALVQAFEDSLGAACGLRHP